MDIQITTPRAIDTIVTSLIEGEDVTLMNGESGYSIKITPTQIGKFYVLDTFTITDTTGGDVDVPSQEVLSTLKNFIENVCEDDAEWMDFARRVSGWATGPA